MPTFRSGLQRDDKSPTRSKIAHFFLFSPLNVLQKSGTHFCPFSDKDMSCTFRDTLQNTGLSRSHKELIQLPGQKYPFNVDAISPAMCRTLKRDVAIISLETFWQLTARHSSGMCGQEKRE